LWRVSAPPAAGAPLLEALERELRVAWLADWAGGLLWLAVDESDGAGAARIRAQVAASGGHATLVRASATLRAAVAVFQPQEPALARLSARVKDSFDPKRILNRGRMYPHA
jgi:glycolate oxidase FAD binding subunit